MKAPVVFACGCLLLILPSCYIYTRMSFSPLSVMKELGRGIVQVSFIHDQLRPEPEPIMVDTKLIGYVNYDVWTWIVGYVVDDMRIVREFPNSPTIRTNSSELITVFAEECGRSNEKGKYGHKMYGFFLPSITGLHAFRVEISKLTTGMEVELWLSDSTHPHHVKKLCSFQHQRQNAVEKDAAHYVDTEPVMLSSQKAYYFELFEKATNGYVTVELKWRTPLENRFVKINSLSYAMAVRLDESRNYVNSTMATLLRGHLPSNALQAHSKVESIQGTAYKVDALEGLEVLPPCEFISNYSYKHEVSYKSGFYEVFLSKVYYPPNANTKVWSFDDNNRIDPEIVRNIQSLYQQALSKANSSYKIERIHFMEETVNRNHGSRFLLEMVVKQVTSQRTPPTTDTPFLLSHYVYRRAADSYLCHTTNFQWKRDVDVHIIITVKNLGQWVKHLLRNFEHIYEVTRDNHLELIVIDFESEDINVKQELENSRVNRWHFISLKGGFAKTFALQAGLDYVADVNSIVMTMDMHLTIPPGFIDYIRKHTIQGKMAYAPIVYKLKRGYTEINVNGAWQIWGYGLYAMYKTDWLAINGFNTKRFNFNWGHEDVDVLDRSLSMAYEVFRIKFPGFLHYHHTHYNMWTSGIIDDPNYDMSKIEEV